MENKYEENKILETYDISDNYEMNLKVFERLPLTRTQREYILKNWDGDYLDCPDITKGLRPVTDIKE